MAPTKPAQKKKRGRPSNASKHLPASSSKSKQLSSQPKKGRGRPSFSNKASGKKNSVAVRLSLPETRPSQSKKQANVDVPVQTTSSQSRKRKAQEAIGDENEVEEPAPKKFQYMKPRTKRVSQVTVQGWSRDTPRQIQEQIMELIQSAARPVVISRRDDEKRVEAEKVIAQVTRTLKATIAHIPLPPKTKEEDFNLDRTLERNRQLDSRLTPAQHSVQLLRNAIHQEELELEQDRLDLAKLEKRLGDQQKRQKYEVTKIHPLLKLPGKVESDGDRTEDINMATSTTSDYSKFEDPDPDLAPLLDQLRRNLESMQGNHAQVQGIDDAVKEARIALDDVLFRHAPPQQYDSM